jgi:flagellar hook-basal body complex protein FliE
MSSPISPITGAGIIPPAIQSPAQTGPPGAFQNAFENALGRVEGLRQTAAESAGRFLAGESEELHSTIMATQRAELAFEMFMQVRNKVVQAYQEVMRMQM